MSSRHSAARPNRAGEDFARTHHNEAGDNDGNAKFDVRNPSILAPDSREEDAILDADVIGGRNATKRGAVNLDGYDSDSDNETFNAKAAGRKKGKVDINEQLDNYDAAGSGPAANGAEADDDDDDDDDMFAVAAEADAPKDEDDGDFDKSGKKRKDVRFLDATQIAGQDHTSKSGGRIRLDDQESEDDEVEAQLAAQEEDVDEEVGAGGLKRNAPKVEAFNLQAEMEEGQFDQSGNYVRKAGDPDAVHDNWLDGLSKKDMKKAAAAHEKRAAEARQQRLQEAEVLASDLLKKLILLLEPSESPLEALARLGKGQTKTKKIPKWKLKKMNKGAEDMETDTTDATQDPEQTRIKESINSITDAADKLLSRDYEEVYDQDRELLIRAYRRETGKDWVEPASRHQDIQQDANVEPVQQWEFRWTDGRDGGAKQGPFDKATMKAWQDAGYFAKGIEFRLVGGDDDAWTTEATFAS
ncbi:GYF domain-containing protein [Pochonia chlamydosporia 170]|uniref:GYF domain-containing protein n=1 Tax=Pochonia chlamydosporia 170 TaxID=1380566 RepID=A0A179G5Z4_METCM|nr:GYF domain-containing protein [Pochonia chlamydosporia 170]OAQ72908.1 GYF domain-containing protein [Pochonia chlamydosporia 170]